MARPGRTLWAQAACVIVLLSAFTCAAGTPQEPTPATTTYSPQELVRRMVETELRVQEQDHSKWRFISRKEAEGTVTVYEKVQTKDGTLRMAISVNGHSLSPSEEEKEEQRLQQFANDPAAQAKKLKAEREDAEKAKRMFQMFPDAFLYTHDGEENGCTVLRFVPNPDFNPPSREAMVFHAMAGKMWIQPKQMRFVKMQASLMDDVKFGWGLLGHLDRGGTMLVEQKEVAPGHWEVVELDLDLKGKIVFFKNLNVQEREKNYRFERLDENIDLAQGVRLLRQGERSASTVAGK
jgi:hypothetical protein